MPIRQFRLRDEFGNSQFGGGGSGIASSLPPNPRGIMDFDGVSDYLERDGGFTGVSDSGNFFFSMFGRFLGADNNWSSQFCDYGANFLYVARNPSNLFQVYVGSTNGNNLSFDTSSGAVASSGWWHLAVSLSLGTSIQKIQARLNDVNVYSGTSFNTWPSGGDTINFTSAINWFIGAGVLGLNKHNGFAAEIYMNMGGSFIDLDITANRRKFLRSNGTPAVLGASGEKPTGTPPTLYLSTTPGGSSADFRTNKGSGGGMFEVGALTSVFQDIVVPMP